MNIKMPRHIQRIRRRKALEIARREARELLMIRTDPRFEKVIERVIRGTLLGVI